jgi:hypothetical protein
MNLPKQSLILPIGISGSGKSTWINSLPKNQFKLVSPDLIRKELTGNISNQENNSKVFSIAYERTAKYIKSAGVSAKESADADEAYKKLIKAIKNHYGFTETKWVGEKLYCEISEYDYKSIFFSDYSSAKDALSNSDDDTLIDYSPPYYGYDGDIDEDYFNEDLSNRLYEI